MQIPESLAPIIVTALIGASATVWQTCARNDAAGVASRVTVANKGLTDHFVEQLGQKDEQLDESQTRERLWRTKYLECAEAR